MSIKWRLFIYLAFFVFLTLVLLWIFQVIALESFYKAIKTRDIKEAAETVSQNINNENLQDLVTRLAKADELCILVNDEDGNSIATAEYQLGSLIHRNSTERIKELINNAIEKDGSYLQIVKLAGFYSNLEGFIKENGSPELVNPNQVQENKDEEYNPNSFDEKRFQGNIPKNPDTNITESLIYVQIVENSSGESIAILINSNISPVDATIKTLRVQLIIVSMVMLLFALVLALVISRRISKPIIKINNSAKELATGNFSACFDTKGYREIIELGETLTYTAGELSKVESLRRELLANISHDLRTPLTMITGYSEVMRDIPNENTPENVQIIIDEAQRLTTLVNDALDISKLQAGTQMLNITEYNLTQSIRSTIQRVGKLTENDGYKLSFECDSEFLVNADSVKISQVIYNLITNAITYTGEDKLVKLVQTIKNDVARIEIIDTGEGIPQEQLPLIWDRYYRIDKTHKRASIGTGLGLSIVKQVLDLHKATYGVESEQGQGSIFWFEIKGERA